MAKYYFLWSIRASLLIASTVLAACGGGDDPAGERADEDQPAQPVEATEITERTVRETVRLTGSVAANESVRIRPETSGQVRRVVFDEGQTVEEGDVLVELDDRELRAQLREAQVRGELARESLARMDALRESNSVSVSERDRALAEYEQTLAEIDLLETRLDKAAVRAPFSGTTGSRDISPGDYVTSADVVTRIDDLSRLKIEFTVPERHATKVEPGTRVSLIKGRDSGSETVEGTVYFVSSGIDRQTRSIEAKAIIESPPPALRPGMFAEIDLVLEVRQNALTVPESAILARDGAHMILVIRQDDDGREIIGMQPVKIGLRERGFVEITPLDETLREGQRVVAAGVGALPLFPGAAVESRPLKIAAQEPTT